MFWTRTGGDSVEVYLTKKILAVRKAHLPEFAGSAHFVDRKGYPSRVHTLEEDGEAEKYFEKHFDHHIACQEEVRHTRFH